MTNNKCNALISKYESCHSGCRAGNPIPACDKEHA
ncbi:MAG: hypothetical protein DRN17_03245 [Thermoplasmata archaeon]|nr:MAG: hypothetical protein DRN17_03245 [Thermoplasmata archaeon]